MAKISKAIRQACAEAQKRLRGNPSVVSVGVGFKYRGGIRTDEICVVVGVKKKLPMDQVPEGQAVMASVDDVLTDVIDGYVSRKTTGATPSGAVFDGVCDKIFFAILYRNL